MNKERMDLSQLYEAAEYERMAAYLLQGGIARFGNLTITSKSPGRLLFATKKRGGVKRAELCELGIGDCEDIDSLLPEKGEDRSDFELALSLAVSGQECELRAQRKAERAGGGHRGRDARRN